MLITTSFESRARSIAARAIGTPLIPPSYEARLRAYRSRIALRDYAYRQRNLAHGLWFRVRLTLAQAERAFVLSAEDAAALVARGAAPEPVGDEMAPAKVIVYAELEELRSLPSAREVAVRLSAEVLSARGLGLVRFR